MLLGYHLMWSVAAGVDGDEEQAERMQKLIVENNYYVAGAVNPRDADLKISRQGGKLVFNGFKHFCTGGVISDLIALEGVYDDTEHRIYAFVKTNQAGVIFSHNWNNMGLRLSESGSVKIENVAVEWSDALGWDAEKKAPRPEISKIPYSTVLLPAIQLVFSNFYLGIALGAQAFAAKYTLKNTRAWPCGGDVRMFPRIRLPGR
jgi:alkylation response protein AidB-like acyl-CoA dehydrogenase